jgi:hypothetical protein
VPPWTGTSTSGSSLGHQALLRALHRNILDLRSIDPKFLQVTSSTDARVIDAKTKRKYRDRGGLGSGS